MPLREACVPIADLKGHKSNMDISFDTGIGSFYVLFLGLLMSGLTGLLVKARISLQSLNILCLAWLRACYYLFCMKLV